MIGSQRRTAALLALLKEEGFDPARLAAIRTPIGLPIGALTPQEIVELIDIMHNLTADGKSIILITFIK